MSARLVVPPSDLQPARRLVREEHGHPQQHGQRQEPAGHPGDQQADHEGDGQRDADPDPARAGADDHGGDDPSGEPAGQHGDADDKDPDQGGQPGPATPLAFTRWCGHGEPQGDEACGAPRLEAVLRCVDHGGARADRATPFGLPEPDRSTAACASADETDVNARVSHASWPVPSQRSAPAAFAMPEDAAAWHSAADAMEEGLVVQDLRGVITLSNPAAERILGLRSDQMHGKSSVDSPWRFVWADGRERTGAEHPSMLVLQSGQPRWADIMGVHQPSGHLIWLSVNSVPVHDADGRLTGVVTAFADITTHREHEELRRARESRLHAAQQLTGLAWWELDLRTGAHVWSDEMFRLVGLPRSDTPPTNDEFLALLHPADRAAATALHERGFDNGHRETFRVVHPDQSVHHLQSWTEVQTDDTGRPVRILGATIDVTEREAALERLADGSATARGGPRPQRHRDVGVGPGLGPAHLVGPDDRADGPRPGRPRPDPRGLHRLRPPRGPAADGRARGAPGRDRRARGDDLPGPAPGRRRTPHPGLDRRPDRPRGRGHPPVGHRARHHPRAGVRRAAAVQRGALPGGVRPGPDRDVDDRPGRGGRGGVPADQRGVPADARAHRAGAAQRPDGRDHPPGRPRAGQRAVRQAGRGRGVVAGLREALPARRRPDRARLDHQLGRARRARASRST